MMCCISPIWPTLQCAAYSMTYPDMPMVWCVLHDLSIICCVLYNLPILCCTVWPTQIMLCTVWPTHACRWLYDLLVWCVLYDLPILLCTVWPYPMVCWSSRLKRKQDVKSLMLSTHTTWSWALHIIRDSTKNTSYARLSVVLQKLWGFFTRGGSHEESKSKGKPLNFTQRYLSPRAYLWVSFL